MKFQFGRASKSRLMPVCHDLQLIAQETLAVGIMDFSIIEGHRDGARQNRYFDLGKSRVKFPDGKHNKMPAEAIDAVPWINGKLSYNKLHCCVLAGIILTCAKKLDVKLRWGGNWDMDSEPITDQDFLDLVHFEIIKGK